MTDTRQSRASSPIVRWLALLACTSLVQACGGHGGGGGGGGGGSAGMTYSTQLTGLGLKDTRRNQAVTPNGVPVNGATITRN